MPSSQLQFENRPNDLVIRACILALVVFVGQSSAQDIHPIEPVDRTDQRPRARTQVWASVTNLDAVRTRPTDKEAQVVIVFMVQLGKGKLKADRLKHGKQDSPFRIRSMEYLNLRDRILQAALAESQIKTPAGLQMTVRSIRAEAIDVHLAAEDIWGQPLGSLLGTFTGGGYRIICRVRLVPDAEMAPGTYECRLSLPGVPKLAKRNNAQVRQIPTFKFNVTVWASQADLQKKRHALHAVKHHQEQLKQERRKAQQVAEGSLLAGRIRSLRRWYLIELTIFLIVPLTFFSGSWLAFAYYRPRARRVQQLLASPTHRDALRIAEDGDLNSINDAVVHLTNRGLSLHEAQTNMRMLVPGRD